VSGTLGPAGQPASAAKLVPTSQFSRLSQARGHLCARQVFMH
jgi:hypothetical protein